jgi:cytidylate kinase
MVVDADCRRGVGNSNGSGAVYSDEKIQEQFNMSDYIITIGRQLGSGGKIIGARLAERLGIKCYDRELINLAAQQSGIDAAIFEKVDEKSNFSILGSYFGFRAGDMAGGSVNYLCNETLFKIQSDVIRSIAAQESCIFVGRCADYILRDHKKCIKIFITASIEDRIRRLCESTGISEKEAKARIEQTDKKRAAYYNYYSNKIWGAAASYDFCLNSSVLGIEKTVEMIERVLGLSTNCITRHE